MLLIHMPANQTSLWTWMRWVHEQWMFTGSFSTKAEKRLIEAPDTYLMRNHPERRIASKRETTQLRFGGCL
jgi:hypothetical protein